MSAPFSFGTAGIRARAGLGDGELNALSVHKIADTVLSYLALAPGARERGVCVAYDGRTDSQEFAAVVVEAARSAGFLVRAFDTETPTPLLAFATRIHGAVAGFMITASHNPPADNGIKLYLAGGAQITAPHDTAIEALLAQPASDAPPAPVRGALGDLGEPEISGYLAALAALVKPDTALPLPVLAYSATCGVGSTITRRVLAQAHATAHEVAAQAEPRADFGGLRSPNPEHEEALTALRAHADAVGAELAFAHDPDADRLAVLTRADSGVLRLLTGDEVGALLGHFLLQRAPDPSRVLCATSHVSGDLLERVAHAAGAALVRTNTGFKWITRDGRAAAQARGVDYVFGYEEAIGYAFGALGDDKDGIAALHVMLALVRAARARGQTLLGVLHGLSRNFGCFGARQISVALSGEHAAARRGALVTQFARCDAAQLLGEPGACVDHRLLPGAVDLLELRGSLGTRVCVRPSGTEPKVKFYLHTHSAVATGEPVEAAEARVVQALDALAARVNEAIRAT